MKYPPHTHKRPRRKSLPTRECGLKYHNCNNDFLPCKVTPHAGVWIEMVNDILDDVLKGVTPHAGVWIEIESCMALERAERRHSPRGSVD